MRYLAHQNQLLPSTRRTLLTNFIQEYGIPRRCPCGGRIIDEVRRKDDYDTLPGKRFFTCKNYEADGLHYRQPWVIGVQEEIERLTKRVEEAEEVMLGASNLGRQLDRLEEQVQLLCEHVDLLTVQVATLEKVRECRSRFRSIGYGCMYPQDLFPSDVLFKQSVHFIIITSVILLIIIVPLCSSRLTRAITTLLFSYLNPRSSFKSQGKFK
ncbi:hypothetical protein Bca52824_076061 [Brassica carinata]|uniref:Zinc finger GRF-type domain-containing protein n=1 Tax=Brassica carinata TaxID=52824 RepID=A0A8X7PU18_BRACI|nr:hypothetical protein Bca52824_076061 [Brassica carinata]